ncbi:hypothetical protein WMY93_012179 [Mugilogobius chulae]|uniref:Phosphoglycerate mutase (2,3-diphosphoglycerate-dependent) n=1 Tax=Mugilogobius chulae TaxID=88201 RepID=A0AAW0PGV5_9GOBI
MNHHCVLSAPQLVELRSSSYTLSSQDLLLLSELGTQSTYNLVSTHPVYADTEAMWVKCLAQGHKRQSTPVVPLSLRRYKKPGRVIWCSLSVVCPCAPEQLKHRGDRMTAVHRLVIVRHGESQWNQENRFCGWFDAELSEKGVEEARRGAQAIKRPA